jgi:hypothetical protein
MATTENDLQQQGQGQDPPADPPVDPVDVRELSADILEKAGLSPKIVAEVRDGFRLQDAFSGEYGERRLRLVREHNPDLAAQIDADIIEEIESEKKDAADEAEKARLAALDEEQRQIEVARLDAEKAEAAQDEWTLEHSRAVHDLAGELAVIPNYQRETWWAERSEAEVIALRDQEGLIPPVQLDWS